MGLSPQPLSFLKSLRDDLICPLHRGRLRASVPTHVCGAMACGFLASLQSPHLPLISTPGLPLPLALMVSRLTGMQACRASFRLLVFLCPWPWPWWAASSWVSGSGCAREGGATVGGGPKSTYQRSAWSPQESCALVVVGLDCVWGVCASQLRGRAG